MFVRRITAGSSMKKNYTILSFDTSCDETSVAITTEDRVMVNIISSQVDLHKKWGGVVPMIAKRAHQEKIETVTKEALARYKSLHTMPSESDAMEAIDAVAVTYGPGLAPALEVGVHFARDLAQKHDKPFLAVNHMEGHLLSSFAKNSKGSYSIDDAAFPYLGLLISGGHTELVLMQDFGDYTILGRTLDDAVGEAFDKVAKLLNLGYPGGPIIEELARQGDSMSYDLPVPMKGRKDMDFSYSGLKTAVRYLIDDITKQDKLNKKTTCNIAASFQRVATESLVDRLQKAIDKTSPKGVLLGGGVVSNLYVRDQIRKAANKHHLPIYLPYTKKLFTDNAAMIGVAAWYKAKRDEFSYDPDTVDRVPNLSFDTKAT